MGGASSRANADNASNQVFISESTANTINKNTIDAVANALFNSKSTVKNTTRIDQKMDFSGCKVKGNIEISGIRMEAIVTVDFKNTQVVNAEQEMAQTLMDELMENLTNSMSTEAMNDMNTKAETEAKAQGILGSGANSETNVANKFNLEQHNRTNSNIENIIATSITTNFNTEIIQESINAAAASQEIVFKNCRTGGSLTVKDIEMKAGITSVVDIISESGAVQKVINDVTKKLDIKIENDTKAHVSNVMTNSLKSVAESIGFSGCPSCPCPGCGDPITASIWIIAILCLLSILCSFASSGISIFMKYKKSQ